MNARTTAGLALTAVAGLALSACSPQLEHPSDEKVETATSQDADSVGTTVTTAAAAEAEVLFIDCFGEPAAEPEAVSADCADPDTQITEITWYSWDAAEATGVGVSADGTETTIELSEPAETGTATVYTVVTVDGVPVT